MSWQQVLLCTFVLAGIVLLAFVSRDVPGARPFVMAGVLGFGVVGTVVGFRAKYGRHND